MRSRRGRRRSARCVYMFLMFIPRCSVYSNNTPRRVVIQQHT